LKKQKHTMKGEPFGVFCVITTSVTINYFLHFLSVEGAEEIVESCFVKVVAPLKGILTESLTFRLYQGRGTSLLFSLQ